MKGSPHIVSMCVWALLAALTLIRYRAAPQPRQRLLFWAFAMGAVCEGVMAAPQLLFHPPLGPASGPPRFPLIPLLEAWVTPVQAVLLIGAFLRYLVDSLEPAGVYMRVSVGVLTPAVLATAAFGPPAHMFMRCAAVAVLLAGILLTIRELRGAERNAMLFAEFALLSRDVIRITFDTVLAGPGPPRPVFHLTQIGSVIGAITLGYIFVRTHSSEIRAGFRSLEQRVGERTAELERAMRQLSDANERLSEANRKLVELSTVDSLTGARNRRFFDEALTREWERAQREGVPLTLALIDVDRFKEINDRHGHHMGDACLSRIATTLLQVGRRPADVVARIGGDEFAVLLPNTDVDSAADALHKVSTAIHALDATFDLTVSIGVAGGVPTDDDSPSNLFKHADRAVYTAKQAGRGRTQRALTCIAPGLKTSASSSA